MRILPVLNSTQLPKAGLPKKPDNVYFSGEGKFFNKGRLVDCFFKDSETLKSAVKHLRWYFPYGAILVFSRFPDGEAHAMRLSLGDRQDNYEINSFDIDDMALEKAEKEERAFIKDGFLYKKQKDLFEFKNYDIKNVDTADMEYRKVSAIFFRDGFNKMTEGKSKKEVAEIAQEFISNVYNKLEPRGIFVIGEYTKENSPEMLLREILLQNEEMFFPVCNLPMHESLESNRYCIFQKIG